jgi:membrane protease YdiL (CAAX protease family)
MLPGSVAGLFWVTAIEWTIFLLFLASAWMGSRCRTEELGLRWRGMARPIVLGAAYSIALRIVIAIATLLVVLAIAGPGGIEAAAAKIRPKTEVLVSTGSLIKDPVYMLTMLTLVSFVLAGLREEMWRGAMLAAFRGVFPAMDSRRSIQVLAVLAVAAVFGLGHLPQGWGGVGLTAVLGAGLGAIIIWHRSIWEAVFAHGFFDATSFLLLWLLAKYQPGLLPMK